MTKNIIILCLVFHCLSISLYSQTKKELDTEFNKLKTLDFDSLKYYPLWNNVDAIFIDNHFINISSKDSIKAILQNCDAKNIEIVKMDSLRNNNYTSTYKIYSNNSLNENITIPAMNEFEILKRDIVGNIKDTIISCFWLENQFYAENVYRNFTNKDILMVYRTNYKKYYIAFSQKQ